MIQNLPSAIASLRPCVAAVLRIHKSRPETVKKGKIRPAQFQATLGGTAVCLVQGRYLLTAFHVLNGGQLRAQEDRFYVFAVPENGDIALQFPVVRFHLERPDLDVAVLEIGPCADNPAIQLPASPVSFTPQPDGTRVLTIGYPSPEIAGLSLDAEGHFMGGQFFLKSHANEGIVAAQYAIGGVPAYELNVGWHHGESGGPIATLSDPPAVFSLMQQYRNIQSPHGIIPGPRRGCSLVAIRAELVALGVTVQ